MEVLRGSVNQLRIPDRALHFSLRVALSWDRLPIRTGQHYPEGRPWFLPTFTTRSGEDRRS